MQRRFIFGIVPRYEWSRVCVGGVEAILLNYVGEFQEYVRPFLRRCINVPLSTITAVLCYHVGRGISVALGQ